ncbi:hypothetical protein [Paenibacillus lignilyticus]|uniref:Uncharacterized protein n=1 Tax=Paenibacillus lignilyticus TaxID=1172615 RepID=A0ABS5CIG7_9BACL|nr:hypothetical protein [Paenibacillus lignilyticus]MBP3965672.1 hypothetical protein [Paenibacillus lignilyticus]
MQAHIGKRFNVLYRLTSAVLIAVTVLTVVGCSRSDQNKSTTEHQVSNLPTITSQIKAGTNPFEVAGIEDPQAFFDVFNAVKTAIAEGDKVTVANHILYPLRVNGTSGSLLIKTRRDFVDRYDAIIDKSIKQAIAEQSADQVFVNYQGVMVGNGDIWFGGSADKPQVIGIIAINHDIR